MSKNVKANQPSASEVFITEPAHLVPCNRHGRPACHPPSVWPSDAQAGPSSPLAPGPVRADCADLQGLQTVRSPIGRSESERERESERESERERRVRSGYLAPSDNGQSPPPSKGQTPLRSASRIRPPLSTSTAPPEPPSADLLLSFRFCNSVRPHP